MENELFNKKTSDLGHRLNFDISEALAKQCHGRHCLLTWQSLAQNIGNKTMRIKEITYIMTTNMLSI